MVTTACPSARISTQAEVSIGLINHHFPTKDALVAEAYRHFNSELVGLHRGGGSGPRPRRARSCTLSSRPRSRRPIWTGRARGVGGVLGHCTGIRRIIQRVQSETYHGYVDLLRSMLSDLLKAGTTARPVRPAVGGHRPHRVARRAVARVVPGARQLRAPPRGCRCARPGSTIFAVAPIDPHWNSW